jgi:FKBP-type peptidyl-prolyl cis-trans isomerase
MHVTGNPKREGTKAHERFSHYEDGITVGAFIEAGGTLSTLRWDQAHDFIAINETAEEKAAWKKRKEAADARDAAEAEEKAKAKAAKKEEADKKKAQAAEKKAAEKAEKGNGEASSKTGTAPKAPPGAGASREAPPAR